MDDKKSRESWRISDVGILGIQYLVIVIVNAAFGLRSQHLLEICRLSLNDSFQVADLHQIELNGSDRHL